MTESNQPPSPDRLTGLLVEEAHEQAVACLERLHGADSDARKRSLRALRSLAQERPSVFDGLATPLTTFLHDDRAVRLTTAKLFVTLARSEPTIVRPAVESLAARLADEGEFYFVRARSAEALGYVALEHPGEVSSPEILADLRIGLSFDEPEVREKLAKAIECIALGDPGRLRHQVPSLAEHLSDERVLVRYHLCTALVVVGCEHPEKLSEAEDALRKRLTDENLYIRGRTAEAFAVLAQSEVAIDTVPDVDRIDSVDDEVPSFVTDRVQFARDVFQGCVQSDSAHSDSARDEAAWDEAAQDESAQDEFGTVEFGTVESVRSVTADVVATITSSDGDDECPHCGLTLSDGGPPMCPRCGAPH